MKISRETTDSFKIRVPVEDIVNIMKKAVSEKSDITFEQDYWIQITLVSNSGRQNVPITSNFEFTWAQVRDKITIE